MFPDRRAHGASRRIVFAMTVGLLLLGLAAALLPATARPNAGHAPLAPTARAGSSELPPEAAAALADFMSRPGLAVDVAQIAPFPVFYQFLPLLSAGGPDPAPAPPPRADVAVTIRPEPSIRVARSSQLTYRIFVRNYGTLGADSVVVELPHDPALIDLTNFAAEGAGDFVSADEPGRTEVTFGPVAAGERRTATLLYVVSGTAPDDTVISVRANYSYEAAEDGGGRSNWAPVLIGSFSNTSRYVFLAVTPSQAPVGTIVSVFSDRFIPYEPVVAWLDTTTGIEPLEVDLAADAFGRVSFGLPTRDLAPGTYEVVLYGQRSRLTGVSQLVLTPNPQ